MNRSPVGALLKCCPPQLQLAGHLLPSVFALCVSKPDPGPTRWLGWGMPHMMAVTRAPTLVCVAGGHHVDVGVWVCG